MLKQQARTIAALLYAADLSVTLATLPVAYLLRSEIVPLFSRRLTALYDFNMYLVLVGPIVLIWTALLFLGGAYRSRRTEALKDEVALVARTALFGSVLLALVVFGARWDFISRPFLAAFFVVNLVFLVAERVTVRLVARRVRALGFNFRTVVLVGDTPGAAAMAKLIRDHPWWGLKLLGLIREKPIEPGRDDDVQRRAVPRHARRLPARLHGVQRRRGAPRRGPRRPAEDGGPLPPVRGDGRQDAPRPRLLPARPRARRARGAGRDAAPHVLDDARRQRRDDGQAHRRRPPLDRPRRRRGRPRHARRARHQAHVEGPRALPADARRPERAAVHAREAPDDGRGRRGAPRGGRAPQRARRPGLQVRATTRA